MEKKTCGPLGGRGSQGGIQDSFRDKAPTVRHPSEVQQLLSKLYKRESVGARDSGIGRKRSSRASSFAISRVLQSDVRCSKSFRCLEASNRSLSLKQKGEENVVQDGDPTFGPSFDQTRRLDVLDRSEGCVPSSSNSSTVKTSSQVLLGREGMAVQGHVFRPFHSTAGFHKTDGPSFVDSSLHGSENLEVSGRLADTGQFTRISSPCKGISDGIVRGVGHHNKSGEVRSDPEAGSNLLGNEDSIYDFEGFSDTEKDRRPSAKYRGVCQSGGTPSVAMVETHRDTNLSHDIGTNGQAQDTPTTVDASQTLGQEGQQDPNTVGPRGAGESSLVVTGEAFNSGSVTENPNAGLDVFLGRFRPGLGSSLGRGICIRRVVRGGEGDVKAIDLGLRHFGLQCRSSVVAVFSDNSTAISYLRKEGGTKSIQLNQLAQEIMLWTEQNQVKLLPQFVKGSKNVVADSLSRGKQIIGTEWTLAQDIVDRLIHKWPATIDLFATALNFRLPCYFSPHQDGLSLGVDAVLQNWSQLDVYAYPPIPLIQKVLNMLRVTVGCRIT